VNEHAKKLLDNVLLASLGIAIVASVLKIMHLPGANQLLIVGLSTVGFAALIKYFSEKTLDGYITGAAIWLATTAVLFKLMHWQGADILIKLAVAAGIIRGIRIFFFGKKADSEE
jgi:hypothetical protein